VKLQGLGEMVGTFKGCGALLQWNACLDYGKVKLWCNAYGSDRSWSVIWLLDDVPMLIGSRGRVHVGGMVMWHRAVQQWYHVVGTYRTLEHHLWVHRDSAIPLGDEGRMQAHQSRTQHCWNHRYLDLVVRCHTDG
jgi:hypothetical protein